MTASRPGPARTRARGLPGTGVHRAGLLRLAFVALFLAALAIRLAPLGRSGFSPDEEITVFAVRGITSEGLPRLPSGVVYDRGLLFTYCAWAAGRLLGDGLPSYRMPSLAAGCLVVLLTAAFARRLGGSPLLAGLLACGATWLVVASAWARSYSLFVACFLGTCLLLLGGEGARRERGFLFGLAATRLLHEMGAVLAALPLFLWLGSPPASSERSRFRRLALRSILVLAVIQLSLGLLQGDLGTAATRATGVLDGLAGAPRLAPALYASSSAAGLVLLAAGAVAIGGLMRVARAPWLLCGVGVICAASLNLGLLGAGTIGLLLARPAQAAAIAASGVLACGASLGLWTAHVVAQTDAAFSVEVVSSLLQAGFSFPSAAGVDLVARWPVAAAAAVAGLVTGWRRTEVRAVAFLVLGCLVFLGAIALSPKPRYFLVVFPLLFALAALLPGIGRQCPRPRPWLVARGGLAALLLVALLADHERGGCDSALVEPGGAFGLSRLRSAPHERWARVLGDVPGGVLVCSDDLACLLLGRRPDYWWLGSQADAAGYGMRSGAGWRSVYTGTPIATDEDLGPTLAALRADAAWVVLLDTVKYGAVDPEGSPLSAPPWTLDRVCEVEGMRLLRARIGAPVGRGVTEKGRVQCSSGGRI